MQKQFKIKFNTNTLILDYPQQTKIQEVLSFLGLFSKIRKIICKHRQTVNRPYKKGRIM